MANVTSSDQDRRAEIDRCLELIDQKSSDESKFVGMLLLPRLIQQDDTATIRHVFEFMNFKFLERLLRTDPSESQQVPGRVLTEIAVNILACFARSDESLTWNPSMVNRIPALSIALAADDETDATEEALHILLAVSTTKEGLVKMLDPDVLKNIFEVFVETKKENIRQLCVKLVTLTYTRTCDMLKASPPARSLASALKYSLRTTLSILSKLFHEKHDELKFEALGLFHEILPSIPCETMQALRNEAEEIVERWLVRVRTGLQHVLINKHSDHVSDQAMVVTYCLLQAYGPDWLFSPLQNTKAAGRRKEEKAESKEAEDSYREANFPALLIHLVAGKASVMLDDISTRIHEIYSGNAVEVDDVQIKQQETMVPVYFDIIENAIQYLSSHFDDQDSGMDSGVLLKLRTSMTQVMDVVMELIKLYQDGSDNADSLEKDVIFQASSRILGLWLAEEGFEM